MTRTAAAPFTFKQSVAPDNTADLVPSPGDLWMDMSSSPPITKKCTASYPFVWVSIEGGGGGGPNFSDDETPSGLVNGSNTTYTLANTPSPAQSLMLHRNGILQQAGGVDYTLSSNTITFVAAPLTGDILIAFYRH